MLLHSQPFTGSVAFSEVDFSVGPSVSVDGAEVTGVGGVAVVVVVVVVVVVAVVFVDVTTVCSGGNPVLRKLPGLVAMNPRGLLSIACVCSSSIVVFVVVVVVIVDITILCSGGSPVLCNILYSRFAVACPPVL